MTTHEFDNSATQAEKRQVLKDTYLARAEADADLAAQGRFKRETATRVTGVPSYPKQPENSFWSSDPVPATEPLGFSVEAMEPNGTQAEIEASIVVDAEPIGVDSKGGPLAPTDISLASVVETGPPKPRKRREW